MPIILSGTIMYMSFEHEFPFSVVIMCQSRDIGETSFFDIEKKNNS